ncbi:MAG: AIR carboxylase family protein, partial [Fibrobacter sp.]|nr:AIR carboxylase family protein [Fibrobacter sp.]
PLNGVDALHSIVQMPPGIPVATVGIGNGKNAGYLAAHIVALSDASVREKLVAYRKGLGDID